MARQAPRHVLCVHTHTYVRSSDASRRFLTSNCQAAFDRCLFVTSIMLEGAALCVVCALCADSAVGTPPPPFNQT